MIIQKYMNLIYMYPFILLYKDQHSIDPDVLIWNGLDTWWQVLKT